MHRKSLGTIFIAGIMSIELLGLALLSGCAESPSKTESARILERQGYRAYQDHRWSDAEASYRKASQLDPQNLKYRNNLSVILLREGKWKKSEDLLHLGQPGESGAGEYILLNRARALLMNHQYSRAKKVLEGIRLSPTWPQGFRRLMAYTDIRTGHFGEAFLLLHETLRRRPRDPVVLGYLSIVYKKDGQEVLAQQNLHRALQLSRSPRFRRSLALLFKETSAEKKDSP